ncbi:hypothetical protein CDA63_14730 [Hymenobacter amundsenii]|uniref:DUF4328 domain-containing protein n=1 Tax=Hymenobacter amundsenii TaxID=2006685 RepID=A0A246FIJ0_9BACT|nr:DUF4328 domain-containing protein [Hymenobacter amundsenii]OWP62338.1 hypothetical protein CDA63_14730 [Hymenobacter amundsenii]
MTAITSPRDNSQRASQSRLLFQLTIALSAVGLVADVLFMDLPADYPLENPSGFGQTLLLAQSGLAFLQIPVRVLTIVFFLQWFRRAYFNLRLLGQRPDHSDSWAVICWFIPILSLFRPYSIMKEIWYGTGATTGAGTDSRTVLRWWWLAYIVHYGLGQMAGKAQMKAETMAQLQSASSLSIISSLADMASAALSILVIGHVHRAEQRLQLRSQIAGLGGPAPEPESLLPTEEESYG